MDRYEKDLCLLVCHHLRRNYPEIYRDFKEVLEAKKIVPERTASIDEALNVRFRHFHSDILLKFINIMRPADDFPSIFTRITKFPKFVNPSFSLDIKVLKSFRCHKKPIYCMVTDTLSRIVATGSDDNTVKVFKLPEFIHVKTFVGHQHYISNLAINCTSTILMSSSYDTTIKLWSLIDGSLISTLNGFTNNAVHLAVFSPSGSMIAAACDDGQVPIWTTPDAKLGKLPCRILKSVIGRPISWVAFSTGGEMIAYSSGSEDSSKDTVDVSCISITFLKSMEQRDIIEENSLTRDFVCFTSTCFNSVYSPKLLAVSHRDGSIASYYFENRCWNKIYTSKGMGKNKARIHKACISKDEKIILVARSNSLFIYDISSGEQIAQFPDMPIFETITCLSASPSNYSLFFVGNSNGDISIVDTCNVEKVCHHNLGEGISECTFSLDGRYCYVSTDKGSVFMILIGDKDSINKDDQSQISCVSYFDENGIYLDEFGQVASPQPPSIDIRELDLPTNIFQSVFQRASTAEVQLIVDMLNNETTGQAAPAAEPGIVATQYIPTTTDIIMNPCGKNPVCQDVEINEQEVDTKEFNFISDDETWNYDKIVPTEKTELHFESALYSVETREDIWPKHLTMIATEEGSYVPQVRDEVMFIKPAYIRTAEELSFPVDIQDDSLDKPTKCTIMKVTRSNFGYELNIKTAGNKNIVTIFPIPEVSPYLILVHRYKSAMNLLKRITLGSTVVVPFTEDDGELHPYNGVVVGINEEDASPFECISIKWENDSSDDTVLSPWEIFSADGVLVEEPAQYPIQNVEGIAYKFIEFLKESKKPFNELESLSSYNDGQLSEIEYPVSLTLIKERLAKSWYRSLESLQIDLQNLVTNITKLNKRISPDITESMKVELSRMFNQIQHMLKNS